jgi:hypothetical protein
MKIVSEESFVVPGDVGGLVWQQLFVPSASASVKGRAATEPSVVGDCGSGGVAVFVGVESARPSSSSSSLFPPAANAGAVAGA